MVGTIASQMWREMWCTGLWRECGRPPERVGCGALPTEDSRHTLFRKCPGCPQPGVRAAQERASTPRLDHPLEFRLQAVEHAGLMLQARRMLRLKPGLQRLLQSRNFVNRHYSINNAAIDSTNTLNPGDQAMAGVAFSSGNDLMNHVAMHIS